MRIFFDICVKSLAQLQVPQNDTLNLYMYAALYYTTIAISILQNTNSIGGLPVYYSITAICYTSVLLYSVSNNATATQDIIENYRCYGERVVANQQLHHKYTIVSSTVYSDNNPLYLFNNFMLICMTTAEIYLYREATNIGLTVYFKNKQGF